MSANDTMAVERLPAVSRVYCVECSGDGRVQWPPAQPVIVSDFGVGVVGAQARAAYRGLRRWR